MPKNVHQVSDSEQKLADFCAALGHPMRVLILKKLLSMDGCYVGELSEELPIAQSTISQHLKKLKNAGLIKGCIQGPKICYCIQPNTLSLLKTFIQEL